MRRTLRENVSHWKGSNKRTWSFTTPHVLYHPDHDDRYYIFVSRISGETIDSMWASLEESLRQDLAERNVEVAENWLFQHTRTVSVALMAIPSRNGICACGWWTAIR